MKLTVLVLEGEKVVYNKVRTVKSTYAFGNFMGATIEMKSGGKRETVRVLPEPTYNKKNPLPYVVLRKTESGHKSVILADFYHIPEVRNILFPVENAMRYITGRLKFKL